VETLNGYAGISKLWSDGNIEDIAGLRKELEDVLNSKPPKNKDVGTIADGIIHSIDEAGKAEILMITAGVRNDS